MSKVTVKPALRAAARGRTALRCRRGFTLVEVLLVMTMVSVLVAIAAPSFRGLSNDLENSAAEAAGFLRQTRTKAMTTTSAYRVVVVSATHLRTEHARRCDDTTWESDGRLELRLRERTTFDATGWTADDVLLCFGSRGIADTGIGIPKLVIADNKGDQTEIEVFVGGAVRVTRLGGE